MRKFSSYGPVDIDDDNRSRYEADYSDESAGVKVMPIFAETGN